MYHLPSVCLLAGLAALACRGPADPLEEPDEVVAISTGNTGAGTGGGTGGGGGSGGASAGSGGAPVHDRTATVVTWNLEQYPLTAEAETMAVTIIQDLSPDVLALQEVSDDNAFQRLVQNLPGYEGVLNDDPGAFLRVGLLWRSDRVEVTDVQTLFPADGYAFPRPPLAARVNVLGAPGYDFLAVVLHLKAQLDTSSANRRRAACERLDEWVTTELGTGDEPDVMLLGDVNDELTDPPQWNVFDAFLDQPERYAFPTLSGEQAGEHTYIPFHSYIDHVIVTSEMNDAVEAASVLPLENQVSFYRDLTDHRPVRATLVW